MRPISVMIIVFVFRLLPNATAFELPYRGSVETCKVRNNRSVLNKANAAYFYRLVHAIDFHDVTTSVLIDANGRTIFIFVLVLVPTLLPNLSVLQLKNGIPIVSSEL